MPEILKLINDTLPALSRGWADGLLTLWASMWMLAFGRFALSIDTGKKSHYGFIFATFPLFLAADVAGASSDCDTLKDELNNKRGADLSVENDAKLFVIERLLQNLNKGQGLGFVVAGKVLDDAQDHLRRREQLPRNRRAGGPCTPADHRRGGHRGVLSAGLPPRRDPRRDGLGQRHVLLQRQPERHPGLSKGE